MFTGIIEETGVVRDIKKGAKSAVIVIEGKKILENTKIGDSISVNGVCLTVASINTPCFMADVMNETLIRSSLGSLGNGSRVNLERAMPADGRFGGHIVSGHIDGVGKITAITNEDISVWFTIKTTPAIMGYVIEKGSIAIDGISLTVAKVFPKKDSFCVSVIPHTAKETVLLEKGIGTVVNLENDMVGKYIEKFMQKKTTITKEFLIHNGF